MDRVSSYLPSSSSSMMGVSTVRKSTTAFDVNSAEFGPKAATAATAATAIGHGTEATDVASSTLSLSEKGLQKFTAGVEDAASALGDDVMSVVHHVESDVRKAYGSVADTVSSALDKMEDFGSKVIDKVDDVASGIKGGVSSAATKVADAAGYVGDGIESVVDTAGHCVAAGLSALT